MRDRSSSAPPMDEAVGAVLASCPQLAAAWIFGSVARGEGRVGSDLDVAILFKRDVAASHRVLGDIASRLEAVSEGRAIDLVDLSGQGPMFRHRVLEEGRLVFDADPERRIDFESTSHVLYFDFRPTWEIAAKASLTGFRDWMERRR